MCVCVRVGESVCMRCYNTVVSIRFFFAILLLLSTFHSFSLICNVLKASYPRRIEKTPMILSVRDRVYFIHALPCYVRSLCLVCVCV